MTESDSELRDTTAANQTRDWRAPPEGAPGNGPEPQEPSSMASVGRPLNPSSPSFVPNRDFVPADSPVIRETGPQVPEPLSSEEVTETETRRSQRAPVWTYLSCAVGLFIYQSLDAIDGKQARRTNSSTPLGELFDHGCDSLSTVFVVLGTCIAVQLGTNPDWMFFCCFAGMFMFYCAHWQTYVSGTLRFGIIDVTEVQIFIITMHLLAVIGGPALWQSMIPLLDIPVKLAPALCTVAGTIFSCTNYFRVIFTGGIGKNGSTIAGTSVLSPMLHIGSVIILATMIYKKSAVQLFEKHPCLYILAFGFVSAKVTNKLVVAHMTKSEMHLHDTAFIGPALLFLDQYFNSFIDEYIVLWIALVFSLVDLIRYSVSVCNQIASHLHIEVFRIKTNVSHFNHH
ncbi:hypothetical protein FKM82_016672 [Ascaphus truei]